MIPEKDVQIDMFGHEIPLDEIQTQAAICTRDETCTAPADGHEPDCPKERELRDTFGF